MKSSITNLPVDYPIYTILYVGQFKNSWDDRYPVTFPRRLIGWIGCESSSIAHRGGIDATPRQPPDTLLAAPEAAVRKDKHVHTSQKTPGIW